MLATHYMPITPKIEFRREENTGYMKCPAVERYRFEYVDEPEERCKSDQGVDVSSTSTVQKEFDNLVSEWREKTGGSSLTMRRYAHPSYQSILVLGGKEPKIVEFILKEMKLRPDVWFEALRRLTGENPASEAKSFEAATKAWLQWGKQKKLIS